MDASHLAVPGAILLAAWTISPALAQSAISGPDAYAGRSSLACSSLADLEASQAQLFLQGYLSGRIDALVKPADISSRGASGTIATGGSAGAELSSQASNSNLAADAERLLTACQSGSASALIVDIVNTMGNSISTQ